MADHALLLQALRNFASVMGRSYDINAMSIQLGERVTEALGALVRECRLPEPKAD